MASEFNPSPKLGDDPPKREAMRCADPRHTSYIQQQHETASRSFDQLSRIDVSA